MATWIPTLLFSKLKHIKCIALIEIILWCAVFSSYRYIYTIKMCIVYILVSAILMFCFVYFRLLGIQRVLVSLLTDWLDDIKKNQIPRILGGVGPIHSVVQLSKIVWLFNISLKDKFKIISFLDICYNYCLSLSGLSGWSPCGLLLIWSCCF